MSKEFSKCIVEYFPPELPINETTVQRMSARTIEFVRKEVNLRALTDSILGLFHRYIDVVASGSTPKASDFQWNLYDEMGIPKNSVFAKESTISPQYGYIDFANGLREVFAEVFQDTKFKKAFIDEENIGFLKFFKGHGYQVPFQMAVKGTGSLGDDLVIYSLTKSQPEGYKIHLTPKPDYAFYTFLRFFSIMKKNVVFHGKMITAKMTLHFRDNNPREENTVFLKWNGGGVPTIVFYANHKDQITKTMLNVLLSEFQEEVGTLGAFTPEYKYRILPFNVRLNSLIAYAQGDRSAKLDNRTQFAGFSSMRVEDYIHVKKYFMPDWIRDMMAQANESRANKKVLKEISTFSLQTLGKDVSLPEVQAMLADPRCLNDICWMTGMPKTMLDPRTIDNLVLETASAGSEEADTSENNLVVHGQEENPVEEASVASESNLVGEVPKEYAVNLPPPPANGGRRKKYRKTKKRRAGLKRKTSRRLR